MKVPRTPTADENANPGMDLSIRYHSTGLANASVNDTCKVDCQGSLLCLELVDSVSRGQIKTYHSKGDPNKGAYTSNSRVPDGAKVAVNQGAPILIRAASSALRV